MSGEKGAVPQWYVVVQGDKIIAGLGVIENDFHDRKDLSPNVCAVHVEEAYRCRGIAGEMRQTTPHFMSGMAGSFCAWFRGWRAGANKDVYSPGRKPAFGLNPGVIKMKKVILKRSFVWYNGTRNIKDNSWGISGGCGYEE